MSPTTLLEQFAAMCEKSRDTDGDRQDDGWGVAWKEHDEWKLTKSLQPIWKDQSVCAEVPPTTQLVAHARSAGFPQHKGILQYNEPYIHNEVCFVFNGSLAGVTMDRVLDGTIGAQKIFSLLTQEWEKTGDMQKTLASVQSLVMTHARRVKGCNIGVLYRDRLYALCQYDEHPEYFGLHYYQDTEMTMVCSEKIGDFPWNTMEKGEIIRL